VATYQVVTEWCLWSGGSFPTLRMSVVTPPLLAVTDEGTTNFRNVRSHLHKDVQSQPQLKTGRFHTFVVEPLCVCAKCFGALVTVLLDFLRPSGESSSSSFRQPRNITHHHTQPLSKHTANTGVSNGVCSINDYDVSL
jgi:hypothetical protein